MTAEQQAAIDAMVAATTLDEFVGAAERAEGLGVFDVPIEIEGKNLDAFLIERGEDLNRAGRPR